MKISFTTDAVLRGPAWAYSIDHLVGTIFDTNWDLYSLCISIGMMYDEQIDSDDIVPDDYKEEQSRYVPRNVLSHPKNASLIEFMMQTALVTTKHLNMSEDDRLQLAFDEDAEPDFNVITFLTRYANAGILKIRDLISDLDITETMESMMTFLQSAYEKGAGNLDDSMIIEEG